MPRSLRPVPRLLRPRRFTFAVLATWLAGAYGCVGAPPNHIAPTSEDASSSPDSTATDAATGADAEAGPTRFCDTVASAPAGETFCADFDGIDLAERFSSVGDAGAPVRASDVFESVPASLALSQAKLDWVSPDDSPRSEVDLYFSLRADPALGNPPTVTGVMSLVRLGVGTTEVAFAYANGTAINGAAHTGYVYRRTAASSNLRPITPPLPAEVWTDIHLSWRPSTGVTISYNNVEAFTLPADVLPPSGTVRLSVGLVASGSAPQVTRHTIDNVVLTTRYP